MTLKQEVNELLDTEIDEMNAFHYWLEAVKLASRLKAEPESYIGWESDLTSVESLVDQLPSEYGFEAEEV